MQQLLTGRMRLPGFAGEWKTSLLGELESARCVRLSRGRVISKKNIASNPGSYPIYSSSVQAQGLFGRFGEYMFDEEFISWSIDGGGHFFYRPKHRFSVTNVCGYLQVTSESINTRFLAYQLQQIHGGKLFDYTHKAHPSVIRKEYELSIPSIDEQGAISAVLSDMDAEIEALAQRRDKTKAIKQGMMQELLTGRTRLVPDTESG
ncbi:MAG: restriction endonuclease subunit S [Thermomicrobiales bacterium]